MDKPTLTFFARQGRAEGIRYLFAVGKIPYNQKFIEFKHWYDVKPSTIFGGLPELEVNGQVISQSLAIGRYVAKLANLYGSDPIEQAKIDMIVETANEFRERWVQDYYTHIEGEAYDEFIRLQKTDLANLSKVLGSNQYFVTNKLSWADIHFLHCVEIALAYGFTDKWQDAPANLKSLYERVRQQPEILKHSKSRSYAAGVERPPKNCQDFKEFFSNQPN